MTPTDDPDIVPLTDGRDCSSDILWVRGDFVAEADHLMVFPWDTPDTLDTDGDPE